jgi:DNA-binding LytR/AlgR family response regulator
MCILMGSRCPFKKFCEKLIVKRTLKSVEELFSEGELVRVHKSYLVARKKVPAVGAGKVTVAGQDIPVGRTDR